MSSSRTETCKLPRAHQRTDSAPTCPWAFESTLVINGFDSTNDRAWCDADGNHVPLNRLHLLPEGPNHCGWEPALLLHVGWPLGSTFDGYTMVQFVRDPAGVLEGWHVPPFRTVPELPGDATDTGFTNGNIRLFDSPAEAGAAIYAVMGSTIERWPRAPEIIACA
jgi:hypothetical protein